MYSYWDTRNHSLLSKSNNYGDIPFSYSLLFEFKWEKYNAKTSLFIVHLAKYRMHRYSILLPFYFVINITKHNVYRHYYIYCCNLQKCNFFHSSYKIYSKPNSIDTIINLKNSYNEGISWPLLWILLLALLGNRLFGHSFLLLWNVNRFARW